jgi:acyl-CoA synthetase (AMP-forming)/AMP-acid ligase II
VTLEDVRDRGASIPIGKPYSAARIHVLGEEGQPVPVGQPGEIFIGGSTVGHSYINRPELTESRFVNDPFDSDPDAKMYRTGDLGHWRADGNLMISGRIDSQVKIGGFRVEPTEIAAQLESLPGVRQAHVCTRETNGRKRLAAYVVCSEDWLCVSELRTGLARRVPSYAIPASIAFLDRLPLTTNGKVDAQRLPAPEVQLDDFQASNELMSDTEKQIARLFSGLLGTTHVGAHDSFFALGGTALQVMQLAVEVEKTMNEKLPLVTMLKIRQSVESPPPSTTS